MAGRFPGRPWEHCVAFSKTTSMMNVAMVIRSDIWSVSERQTYLSNTQCTHNASVCIVHSFTIFVYQRGSELLYSVSMLD